MSRTFRSGSDPWITGQLYYFHYDIGADAYVVESVNGGCVDIFDGVSQSKGAKLAIRVCDGTPSQLWESKINGAGWYLKNEWSGLYATQESFGENTPIIQWPNLGIARQRFAMPPHFG